MIPGAAPGMIPGAAPGMIPGANVSADGQQSVTPRVQLRPGWVPQNGPMSPGMAVRLLIGKGYTAGSYYNGMPDVLSRANANKQVRTRDLIKKKLQSIVVPRVDALDTLTMNETINRLEVLFRDLDPGGGGFQFQVNPFIDPGGAALATNPSGGGSNSPAGGLDIDPVTGLPIGGAGGAAGAPAIDPVTGLPIAGGAGLPGAGLPGAGLPGAGLPGMGGGLPGMGGGLPGMGGGGAPSTAMEGAFDADIVRVKGLTSPLVGMTAKQVLDVVTMSFDHPIQYVVMDHGIMFFQQDPKFAGTVTQTFSLNLNTRTLQTLGLPVPQLGGGGGQGQGPGGGQGQGPDGGYPGGADGSGPDEGMGEEMMAIPKIRPFNSMGGYHSPQRFNSFSARPKPSPKFRR